MANFSGVLKKMQTYQSDPIAYYLELENDFISVNQLIGKKITLEHNKHYQCMSCGKDLPIYAQGYCKTCYFIIPQTNPSVFRPELSTAHLGIEQKDLEWEKNFELQPHIVYLAITGGLKVGVTRKTQIPTRWIDQGAMSAIIIAETPNRYEAGLIEVELAKSMSDKTSYKKMLLSNFHEIDLVQKKKEVKNLIPDELIKNYVEKDEVMNLSFPVNQVSTKIEIINFNKTDKISNRLIGIKGQYLIFEDGKVFNIRGAEGYIVTLFITD
jgi:hypothetical protein